MVLEGLAQAFAAQRPAMRQLDTKAVGRVYLDVRKAAWAVLTATARLAPYAAEIRQLLGGGIDEVAQLKICARAALHADVEARATLEDPLPPVAEQAYALRALMMSSANALSQWGLLPAGPLAQVSMVRGYAAVASDLHGLVELYEAHWDAVHDKTPLRRSELERARSLSERIISEVVDRQVGPRPDDEPDAASYRKRAFTLMTRQYARVRRAMTFIAGEAASKAIAPPLAAAHVYKKRRRPARAVLLVDAAPPAKSVRVAATDPQDPHALVERRSLDVHRPRGGGAGLVPPDQSGDVPALERPLGPLLVEGQQALGVEDRRAADVDLVAEPGEGLANGVSQLPHVAPPRPRTKARNLACRQRRPRGRRRAVDLEEVVDQQRHVLEPVPQGRDPPPRPVHPEAP